MQKDLIKEFNLPGYIKGKSFAEASTAIDKKFEGRTDPQAQKTKEELLERLAEAQEYVKMQEQIKQQSMQSSMDNNAQEVPDMMQGQVPEGMEEFSRPDIQGINKMFLGGAAEGVNPTGATTGMSGMDIAGGAMGALEIGMDAFGPTGVDTSGNSGYVQKENVALGAIGQGAKGAAIGSSIAPGIGTAIGAGVGLIGGFLGSKKQNKEATIANQKADRASLNRPLKNGGYVNKYAEGGFPNLRDPLEVMNLESKGATLGQRPRDLSNNNLDSKGAITGVRPKSEINKTSNSLNSVLDAVLNYRAKTPENTLNSKKDIIPGNKNDSNFRNITEQLQFDKENSKNIEAIINNDEITLEDKKSLLEQYGPDAMRMLSPIANLYRAANLDEAEIVKRNTLDSTFNPAYMDINDLVNQVTNNYGGKNLSEASGGNLGGLMAGQIAKDAKETEGLSKAAIELKRANQGQTNMKSNFDFGVDRINLQQANADLVDNQASRGARETAKQNLISAGIQDIGAIGKELQDRQIAGEATGYKWDGEYISKGDTKINPSDIGVEVRDGEFYKDGKKITKNQVEKLAEAYKKEK